MATVRKIYNCRYTGTISYAPRTLEVPSQVTSGRPTSSEIVEALMNKGFDKVKAVNICNNGASWVVE